MTNTAVSSARLYWESKLAFFAPKGVPIPTAVSVFPDEIYAAPRSWTEKAYPKLIHYNRLPKGRHFAAWEQPELFTHRAARGIQIAALIEAFERTIMKASYVLPFFLRRYGDARSQRAQRLRCEIPTAFSRCVILVAPMIGAVTGFFCNSQASAT